jgi:hypothetical protein
MESPPNCPMEAEKEEKGTVSPISLRHRGYLVAFASTLSFERAVRKEGKE